MATIPLPSSLQKSINDTKVDYVRLGTAGLHVSVPILGAMGLGSKEWESWILDKDESVELLKAAYDRGINTWDTANMYSNGISEEVIGRAITKYNIPRDKLVIMTKCFVHVGEETSIITPMFGAQMNQSKDYINHGGGSPLTKSFVQRLNLTSGVQGFPGMRSFKPSMPHLPASVLHTSIYTRSTATTQAPRSKKR